jgi:septal ring factor EnvC (AmiA/AmiB activator)
VRITVAVIVLCAATALVAGAVAVGGGGLVAASAVVALLCGWAGLRIMWSVVHQARHEHSADRAELARTYRQLFAERAVENDAHTKAMTARMRERDCLIRDLETTVVATRRRASVAERTLKRVQRRLAEAGGRIITLEEYLARSQAEHRAALARLEAAEAEARARRTVVPEWADLETDPTAALMAWEEHAQHHVRDAKNAVDARTSKRA